MAGLDNKISNVLGAALPYWLKNQIQLRSQYNNQSKRDDLNISYLTNQTAWVRLVSSVNINAKKGMDQLSDDMSYFKYTLGISDLQTPEDLAKKYMLFGGTTQYINQNQNKLRFGLGQDGAYGMLGEQEINKFGYRPMPGISDVKIETQGRLGSVRMATINFKVWDKMQLDVMDALYFKLGYTMLLEWGHTVYISQEANSSVQFNYSELYAIDPFQSGITKEKLNLQLAQNSRKTQGNYDGMLGIVSNFNFSFNQEGGYDCSLKIIGLGSIGDSLKINNPSSLPDVVKSEVKAYLDLINKKQQEAAAKKAQDSANAQTAVLEALKTNDEESVQGESYVDSISELGSDSDFTYVYDSKSLVLYSAEGAQQTPLNANQIANNLFYFKDRFAVPQVKNFLVATEPAAASTKVFLNLDLLNIKANNNEIFAQTGARDYTDILAYNESLDYKTINNTGAVGFETNLYGTRSSNTGGGSLVTWIQYPQVFNSGRKIIYRAEVTVPQFLTNPSTNSRVDLFKLSYNYISSNNFINKIYSSYNIHDKIASALKDPNGWSVDYNGKYNDITIISFSAGTSGYGYVPSEKIDFLPGIYKDTVTNNGIPTLGLLLYKTITVSIPTLVTKEVPNSSGTITVNSSNQDINYDLYIGLRLNDASMITNFTQTEPATKDALLLQIQQQFEKDAKQLTDSLKPQEAGNQESIDAQIDSSLRYQSNLELAVKAIELYSLTQAVKEANLDIDKKVKSYSLSTYPHRNFLNNIMKYGVFNKFLDSLFDGTINEDLNYGKEEDYVSKLIDANDDDRFKIFCKYGFNSSIMGGKTNAKLPDQKVGVPAVDYSELTTTYVVPYEINQPTEGGGQIIHPVYMQLGFLLMIINAMSTIYESEPIDDNTTSPQNKPLVYIDFNPETNLCLTNSLQFTTNPFSFLIPLQSTLADYKTLFSSNTIDNSTNEIKAPTSGSASPLYDPGNNPNISKDLPKFRAGGNKDAYRGKTMKILISCEYVLDLIKQFADHNGLNKVFLKPFLDQLVVDMNKSLGAMNIFRVAYDDTSNCFTIIDDQVQPLAEGEDAVTQNASDTMPVYGVNSIAKSLNIQTEISSNLGNMVAISANSNPLDQSANSTNASSYGFINNSYRDRYIPVRKDLSADEIKNAKAQELAREKVQYDSILKAEQKFNTTIERFYGTTQPNKDDVSPATNYYIDRITKTNNQPGPTRSSAMIPVSVNFTTRGISGFHMGHAFTLPSEILPYTYSSRHTPTLESVTDTDPTADVKVAFATVGLSHTIQANVWDTSIKGSMILIKDQNAFSNATINTNYSNAPLLSPVITTNTNYVPGNTSVNPPTQYILNPYVSTFKTTSIAKLPTGIKTLMAAQTQNEGFFPTSISYTTNNPGNVGTTNVSTGNVGKFNTLAEGIVAQWNQVLKGALNIDGAKSQFYNPNMSLYQYISIYAPASDPKNNPSEYTNFIIGFFKSQGITITANTTLSQIYAINQNVPLWA